MFARVLCIDRDEDLGLGLRRVGASSPVVPSGGRALLLTGLGERELPFLRGASRPEAWNGKPPVLVEGSQPGAALLLFDRDGLAQVVRSARGDGLSGLAEALERAEQSGRPPAPLVLGERRLEWGARTYVMGVVNVTPDSFSDGGQFADPAAAIAHGVALAEAGADLIDVGGESTRPGAQEVSESAELGRVLPVIEGLRARVPAVPLSVDTMKSHVARRAIAAGASLVNDVGGLRDPEMIAAVADTGAAACLMHMQGTPRTMQQSPRYEDVVEQILEALDAGLARATRAGVPRGRLLVDPGIGFGKTVAHNLFLLRRLRDFRVLGVPVLIGASRKSFHGQVTGGKSAGQRLASSVSAAVIAAMNGADVVRVHDVAETKDALAVADAVRAATDGGSLYPESGRGAG